MDSTTLRITDLDGSTRVRSNGQLMRLEDFASTPGHKESQGGEGPQGIQGEPGEDGADGTVDTTNHNIKAQVDFFGDQHPIDWNISGSWGQGLG